MQSTIRVTLVLSSFLLAVVGAGCKGDECSRTSDCPAGHYCSDRQCVPFGDAPGADADADGNPPDVAADGDADGDDRDDAPWFDGPAVCTPVACEAFCSSVDQSPGECVENECFCRGGGTDIGADGDEDGGLDVPTDGDPDEGWLCREDWECDDHNACTSDHCSYVSRACVNLPLPEGAECSDGLHCNGMETCSGGGCVAGSAPCISTSPECSAERCDETTDSCIREDQPDGTLCEEGSYCRGPGSCQAGDCLHSGPYPCPPVSPEPCSVITCNEAARTCDTVPKPDGASCDDGVTCNGTETCVGGTCTAGRAFCDDSNACTNDICVEDRIEPTCSHTPIPGC